MKNILLLLFFTANILLAAPPTTENTPLSYMEDTQRNYKKGNIAMECPIMRPEYVARVYRMKLNEGITICRVYKLDPATNIPSDSAESVMVENYNPFAKDHYTSLSASDKGKIVKEQNNKYKDFGKNMPNAAKINDLKTKYFKNYITTGDTFLTGSKYLLSGVLMDGEIIDIPNSIHSNEVVLHGGYTIYPNHSSTAKSEKAWWDGFLQTIGWSGADEIAKTDTDIATSVDMRSQSKTLLGNVIVFIMDFFSEFNSTYQEINFIIMVLVLPFTFLFAAISKVSKKLRKQQDPEDWWERSFLAILIVFLFYVGQVNYKIDEDKALDQTHFQNFSRMLLYKGVDWADLATRAMASSFVSFKMKDAGIISKERNIELREQEVLLAKRIEANKNIATRCFAYYDTDKLQKVTASQTGVNQIFPSPNQFIGVDYAYLKPTYAESIYSDANGILAQKIPTLDACYFALRGANLDIKEKEKIGYKLNDFDAILANNGIVKRMNLVAEHTFKNVADNGFLAAPAIGASNIFINNAEIFNTVHKDSLHQMDKIHKNSDDMGEQSFAIDTVEDLTDKAVYMMLPGADSLRNLMWQTFKVNDDNILSSIANGVTGTASIAITIAVMVQLVAYAPILALLSSSILVIVFYYLGVQIFFIITPFIVVYAFASNQIAILVSLLSRFMALALTPIILVITILLALLAINIFQGINENIVINNFDMFMQVFTAELDKGAGWWEAFKQGADEYFGIFAMAILASVLKLLASLFATIGVFHMIFNGKDIIFNMFGFREGSMDVQEGIGSQIDNSMSKYHKII